MAHKRQQIRERVATTLTGLSTTGSNVFQSRVYPIENTKLPCLLIYTREETSEPLTTNPPRAIEKILSLVVEAYVKANANYDDTIDTINKIGFAPTAPASIKEDAKFANSSFSCFFQPNIKATTPKVAPKISDKFTL